MILALYIATAVGALSLFMMMPRRGFSPWRFGSVVGAATVGLTSVYLAGTLPEQIGIAHSGMAYHYVFSLIAIGAAARVVTHQKPVYAALWFVMVVLASAGMFLILEAEFIAFAMVIIYGGAILVTYVFVIMLATQGAAGDDPETSPTYDAVAREPLAAITVCFILLAALLTVFIQPVPVNPSAAMASDARILQSQLTRRPAQRLADRLENQSGLTDVTSADRLENIERVGLDLFEKHPLGLELAGVILMVSLVGAVVIARKRVDEEASTDAAAKAPTDATQG